MTSRWFCYVEGVPEERCLSMHWIRAKRRTETDVYREYPYPVGHEKCGWVEVPEKADKRELAA